MIGRLAPNPVGRLAPNPVGRLAPNPVGRLAPTPSGILHLGNVVAFAAAWLSIRHAGGKLLLRVEDVDAGRARADLEAGLRRDLQWLGLHWDEEVRRQSARDYQPFVALLDGRTYRCTCTRRQLASRPCACRDAGHAEGALRFRLPAGRVTVLDRRFGACELDPFAEGDPVLLRRDGGATYTLAVVADDVVDGVSEVVRGADLLGPTAVQVRLWEAFGATVPTWLHAPLVLGPDGKKLSKSHGALHVGTLRAAGWTPPDLWRLVLPWLGIDGTEDLATAARHFDPRGGPRGPLRLLLPADGGCPTPQSGLSWVGDSEEGR